MLSKINSFGLIGINGYLVQVELDICHGLPSYSIVGLADTAIKESKERVASGIKNQGYVFPIEKVVVNLAPANTKKEGSIYDLPIAVGILVATGQISTDREYLKNISFIGELSLDGSLRKIDGILPILITAKDKGVKRVVIPFDNASEASFIEGLEIYAIKTLKDVVNFLNGNIVLQPLKTQSYYELKNKVAPKFDFSQIKGQASAKRALEISAAGGHNVLMIGPPGSGKTMLARAFPGILPDLTFEEALEITKIHSIAGVLDSKVGIIVSRPFRSPHHTSTTVALMGGGNKAKPGEVSLAHNGVLFLDEMPEYSRQTIEALRQPLEDGTITISRNVGSIEYPANFILIASMNPCPCGNYGSTKKPCKCSPSQIHKYLSKLSGPLMDRIDMYIEVDGVDYGDLSSEFVEENSENIKKRVDSARKIQTQRFESTKVFCNAKMNNAQIKKYCQLDKNCSKVLEVAFDNLKLTGRAYNRILKVARTIADLEGSENIEKDHIIEAISYRNLDDKYWI